MLTARELRDQIAAGALDPRVVLHELLQRISRINPAVGAYVAVDPERITAQLEERLRHGPRGPLFGVPITIKDNLCVRGEETACGSRILSGFRPPYHATVVERLLQAGAIVIPRANMDEFAFGSSTETSAFGPTRNPWDVTRVPGGSSGGSAAAVAAGAAVAALGTDTGGSIRQPAAFCGVVGLKPTYGRVSRYGLIAFASSLDQAGPITQDVTDCALLLSVIAGQDPRDSTSAPMPVPDYLAAVSQTARGLRVGLPKLPAEGLDGDVRAAMDEATRVLERLGLTTVPVELPHIHQAIETYYIIATAEASSNLARYDGVRYGWRASEFAAGGGSVEPSSAQRGVLQMYLHTRAQGFGPEALRRILLGTYVLSRGYYDAYYLQGMKVRTLMKRDFDAALSQCDVLLLPTAPTPAFRLGEKLDNPLQMYLSDIYTISANLAGVPAISLPCGFSSAGLPIGMQLIAAPFQEATLLRAARAYEQATDWHRRHPAISSVEQAR